MNEGFDKAAFFAGLAAAPHWPLISLGWPHKPLHAANGDDANYWDFDSRPGLGFRAIVGIAPTRDHIRVELFTNARDGRALVQALQDGTHAGSSLEALRKASGLALQAHVLASGAKLFVAWDNASLACTRLAAVHHLWVATTLEVMAEHVLPLVEQAEAGNG